MISGSEKQENMYVRMGQPFDTGAAPAALVNRTHRVVRERARTLNEQKSRIRSLWIPFAISFGLLALLLCAVWQMLDETEFFPDGLPDSAQQMMVLSMWCLPLSVIVLAVVWFRRSKSDNRHRSTR